MGHVKALRVVGALARQLFSLGNYFSVVFETLSCVKQGSNQSVTSGVLGDGQDPRRTQTEPPSLDNWCFTGGGQCMRAGVLLCF